MMETISDFVSRLWYWMIDLLQNELSWIYACTLLARALTSRLLVWVWETASSVGRWIAASFTGLFHFVTAFCQGLITFLRLSENGMTYLVITLLLMLLSLLIYSQQQSKRLAQSLQQINSQNHMLARHLQDIRQDQQDEREAKNREAMVKAVVKFVQLLFQQE